MADPIINAFDRIRQRRDRRRAGWGTDLHDGGNGPDPGMRGKINPLDSQAMMDRAQGVDITDVNPPTQLLARRDGGGESPFRTAQYSGDEDGNADVPVAPVADVECEDGKCFRTSTPTVRTTTTSPVQATAQPSSEQQAIAAILESKGLPVDPRGQAEYHNSQMKAWAPLLNHPNPYTRNSALTQYRIHMQGAVDAAAMAQAAMDSSAKLQHLQSIKDNEAQFYKKQREVMEMGLPEGRRQMELRLLQDPHMSPYDIARAIQVQRDAARKEAGTVLEGTQKTDELDELAGAAAGFRFGRSAGIALAAKRAGQGGAAGQFGQDAWNTIRSHYGSMWNATGKDPIEHMQRDLMQPLTASFLLHNTSRDGHGSPQHQLDAANEAAVTIEAYHRLLKDWKESSQGASGRAIGLQGPARVMLPQSAPRSNSPIDYSVYGPAD